MKKLEDINYAFFAQLSYLMKLYKDLIEKEKKSIKAFQVVDKRRSGAYDIDYFLKKSKNNFVMSIF